MPWWEVNRHNPSDSWRPENNRGWEIQQQRTSRSCPSYPEANQGSATRWCPIHALSPSPNSPANPTKPLLHPPYSHKLSETPIPNHNSQFHCSLQFFLCSTSRNACPPSPASRSRPRLRRTTPKGTAGTRTGQTASDWWRESTPRHRNRLEVSADPWRSGGGERNRRRNRAPERWIPRNWRKGTEKLGIGRGLRTRIGNNGGANYVSFAWAFGVGKRGTRGLGSVVWKRGGGNLLRQQRESLLL